MTPAQKVMLMIDLPNGRPPHVSLFTRACQFQGWNKSDRDLRLRLFSLALNFKFSSVLEVNEALENYELHRRLLVPETRRPFRHVESAAALNNTGDVDAVKNLLLMLAGNLAGAAEQGRPQDGQGRRFDKALADYLQCLAIYPLDHPMGRNGAAAYAFKIAQSKVRGLYALSDLCDNPGVGPNRTTGLIEIKPSEREEILMTIAARLNGKGGFRARAGHGMHDMYQAAGLPCPGNCRRCQATATPPAPVEPALPLLEALPSAVAPAPASEHAF